MNLIVSKERILGIFLLLFSNNSGPKEIVPGGKIKEIPTWGPSYEISFELKVNKFDGQIIYLTNEQNPGDGVPTVVAADNRLEIYTDINGVDDKKFITREIKARKWYYVVISQKPSAKNPKVVISRFHERV